MKGSPETLEKIRSLLAIAPNEMKEPLEHVLQLTPVRSGQETIPCLIMEALYDDVPLQGGRGKVAIYTNTGYGRGWLGVCMGRPVSSPDWECQFLAHDGRYRYCLSTRPIASARESTDSTPLDMVADYMAVHMVPYLSQAMEALGSTEATVGEETKKPPFFKALLPSTMRFRMEVLSAAMGNRMRRWVLGLGLVASTLLNPKSKKWEVVYISADRCVIEVMGDAKEILWIVVGGFSVSVALQGEEPLVRMAARMLLREPFFVFVGTFAVPGRSSLLLRGANILQACRLFGRIIEETNPFWSKTNVKASLLSADSPGS